MNAYEMVERVARAWGFEAEEVLGRGRESSIAHVRNVAAYMVRDRLALSFPELGRLFDNRDHTTAMHSVRRVTDGLALGKPAYVAAVRRANEALGEFRRFRVVE